MSSVLDDFGVFLQTNGFGTVATDIVLGPLPPGPDACIAFIPSGGAGGVRSFSQREWDNVRLQVFVRDADYGDAFTTVVDLYHLCDDVSNTTINGTVFGSMQPLQFPYYYESDRNGRQIFAFNLELNRAG